MVLCIVESDAAGALFYRVYLSRNLVIAASGAIFLLTRQWTPLAVILTVCVTLPLFDMSFLSLSGVTPPALHPVVLALIILAAGLMWRRETAVTIAGVRHAGGRRASDPGS